MPPIPAQTLDREPTTVPSDEVEEFRERLRGPLLTEGDDGYEKARTVWNAMIDRRPALIAQCTGTADVMAAVRFAREHELLVSVAGGGHNVAGDAVCDGGLMIDLSPMNQVQVDPETQRARVGPGATVGDLDHETQAFGLATTGGFVSTTGMAGITLGGGLGWLSRKCGLVHDNLISADVVTAEGEFVRASEQQNPNLFWGLRGGGGNFGVVTSFEFELHEVGPEVLAGPIIYRYEDAAKVLRRYRDVMADAPDEVQCYAGFSKGNPELGLPESLHGETVVVLLPFYAGEVSQGQAALEPLRTVAEPVVDAVQTMPYATWQRSFDERWEEGYRNYWKSHVFRELSDGAIETMIEWLDASAPFFSVFIEWMGGAVARAEASATAFPHRDKAFSLTVGQRWSDPDRDDEVIGWARSFHEAMTPHAAEGVYVNYLDQDEGERISEAYGDPYERLVELKNEWDPENQFRMNQNIEPTV